MQKIMKSIATLGRIGYLPAPGTMGTLVTLPCAYLILLCFAWQQVMIISTITTLSLFIVSKALMHFNHKDPSNIILDEVVGCLVTFYGIKMNWFKVVLGFILFRFFDICKPLGLKKLEKLPGAWGIIADDFVAGLIVNYIFLRYLFV